MQSTDQRAAYYTYEEACELLSISYSHLLKCIMLGVFHPHRPFKGPRKYLLKSEVNNKIGKHLYSLRKPKSLKSKTFSDVAQSCAAPATVETFNDVNAVEIMRIV